MLADDVAEVLRPGGPLAGALAGFEPRHGQCDMARRVAHAIDNDERLLCEAGTGTGKTIAYLIPAILSGRKVVVSTGTKTLQDQIASVDLPRLQDVLGIPFSFAVMKGLSNYLCLRRFHEHTRQGHIAGTAGADIDRLQAWMAETATGDRAELDDLPDDAPIWREVTATPETRLGPRCAYFDRCFVTKMRQRGDHAQVVLVNHHLFFADLALRTRWPDAQVLPPHEVAIFDEAHQLEDVATEFFGLHVSTQRLFALGRDIARARVPPIAHAQAESLGRRVQGATDTLGHALRARLPAPRTDADELRVPVPDNLWESASAAGMESPLGAYHGLDTVLDEAAGLFARLASSDPAVLEGPGRPPDRETAAALGGLAARANAIRSDLSAMVGRGHRDQILWVAASSRNVSLRSSPVQVASTLQGIFRAFPGPMIFTSATLTTAGRFDYLCERVGLADTAATATFPSPFRFDRQALVYLAADLPDPNTEPFPSAAAERMVELCHLSHGRALLLFTSFRNLHIAEQRLRAEGSFPLLVQGEKPRNALLEALRARKGSVLLATQSFWEGVDVPGDALSLVVMDRLPFAVPDDPLVAARLQRIREEGGDPFGTYQLPRTALALKQGFGRLIRTRQDRGVVAILDGRILRRSYGNVLQASLPRECPRTESIDEVARFFGSSSARPPAPAITGSVEP